MRRLRLVLEYDGTDFCGFQRQQGRRTVQEVVEEQLSRVCGHAVGVMGAGRTDAGVHALGQVVHFDTHGNIPTERIGRVVSSLLNGEVVLRHVEETTPAFHARFGALRRTYHYYVLRRQPTPFEARYALFDDRLRSDAVERMRAALPPLLGRHDFGTFCGARMETRTMVRTLTDAELRESGPLLRLELTADAFLRSMVRLIVANLLEIGRGRLEPEALERALKARDRSVAGMPAPPQGLFLKRVEYPDGYPSRDAAEPGGFAEEWLGPPFGGPASGERRR